MTVPDGYASVVQRRRWVWRVTLAVLVAATVFCGWGVVDELSYSRDVAAHYQRASGAVVRDNAAPSGLAVAYVERNGQSQQYQVDRGEQSDLELRIGDRTEVRYNEGSGEVFLQDEDGPAPLIPAVLGLIAVVLLVVVGARGRRWVHAVVLLPEGASLLKTVPGASTAYLHASEGKVEFVLPRYFGISPWTIPITDVALLRSHRDVPFPLDDEGDEGLVFARPLQVPYLPTGMQFGSPNLMLLFSRPVQVPLLRRILAFPGATQDLPFSYREVKKGVSIDGVELRAVDPGQAELSLANAGVALLEDPDQWLAEHREVVHDEQQRAALIAYDDKAMRWGRRLSWLSSIAVAVLIAARILGDADSDAWFAVTLLAAATSILAPFLIERVLRRSEPGR